MSNDLIVIENGIATLTPEVEKQYTEALKLKKDLEEKIKTFNETLLTEMENKGIISINSSAVGITYFASSDRETFDKDKFKEEHPELYDDYVKFSPVKSSIRVKVK